MTHHKSRDLTVRQPTMLINALRRHLAEHGIATGVDAGGVTAMLKAADAHQENSLLMLGQHRTDLPPN